MGVGASIRRQWAQEVVRRYLSATVVRSQGLSTSPSRPARWGEAQEAMETANGAERPEPPPTAGGAKGAGPCSVHPGGPVEREAVPRTRPEPLRRDRRRTLSSHELSPERATQVSTPG
ncbi:hypothetical protein GCM10010424_53070 [Streptomyces lienomycini]